MKLKFWLILVFALKLYVGKAVAFQKITTGKELEFQIQRNVTCQTLVIFDVDYVLITPKDKIFRFCGEQNGLRQQLFKNLKKVTQEKYKILNEKKVPLSDFLMSVIIKTSRIEAVDQLITHLITKLKKQNIPVIALTQNLSGPIGQIASQSEKKINDLKEVGIDLTNTMFGSDVIVLNNVSSNLGLHPVYDRGVIFANSVKKGEVLKAFLEAQNFTPKNIIFIDDRQECLESVDAATKTLGIPYVGLQFTQLSERGETVDKALAEYQFHVLLEQEVWLDDAAAEKEINQQTSCIR